MKEFKDVRDDYDELEKWTNDFISFSKERGIDLADVYDMDLCITYEVWIDSGSKDFYEFNWFYENYCINDLTNDLLFSKLLEKMNK